MEEEKNSNSVKNKLNSIKNRLKVAKTLTDFLSIKEDIDSLKTSIGGSYLIEELNKIELQITTKATIAQNRTSEEISEGTAKNEQDENEKKVVSLERESEEVHKLASDHTKQIVERNRKLDAGLDFIRNKENLTQKDLENLGIVKSDEDHKKEREKVGKIVEHIKKLEEDKNELLSRTNKTKSIHPNIEQSPKHIQQLMSSNEAHIDRVGLSRKKVMAEAQKICEGYLEKKEKIAKYGILAEEAKDKNPEKYAVLNKYANRTKKQNAEIIDILSKVPELRESLVKEQGTKSRAEEIRKNLSCQHKSNNKYATPLPKLANNNKGHSIK